MVKHETDYVYTRPTKLKQYSDCILPVAVFFGSLALYIYTMATTVFWGRAATFILAENGPVMPEINFHPLYDIIGRSLMLIPDIDRVMVSNLISAVTAALTVMFFYMIVRHLLDVPVIRKDTYRATLEKRKLLAENPELRQDMRDELDLTPRLPYNLIPNLAVTALFAVTLPIWLGAVRANIYSLQAALIFASFYFVLLGLDDENRQNHFYLGLWFYALSFANIPKLSLFLAPAYIVLIFVHARTVGRFYSVLIMACLLTLIGWSVYLFIPFNAAFDIKIPDRFGYFDIYAGYLWEQVYTWILSIDFSRIEFISQIKGIGLYLASQIGWPFLVFSMFGLAAIIKVIRNSTVFLILLHLGSLAVLVLTNEYSYQEYNHIYLMIPLCGLLLIFALVGAVYSLRLSSVTGKLTLALAVVAVGYTYVNIDNHIPRANLSNMRGPKLLSREILNECPSESIILLKEKDLILPLSYYSSRYRLKNEVCIVYPRALGNPFYRNNLKSRYPDLALPDWPRNEKVSISPEYLQQFCRVNFEKDIYIQPGVNGLNQNHLNWARIMLKYNPGGDSSAADRDLSREQIAAIEKMVSGNLLEYRSKRLGGEWLMQMGAVYQRRNQAAISRQMYQAALTLEPDNINHRLLLAAGLTRDKQYKEALKLVAEALQIDSRHPEALRLGQRIVRTMEQEKNLAAK